ncbi:tRNA-specific adenosine deaminase 1 [Podila clonocystis]|nr:tRNA-specific adenosine deaminase 1 [Podila clonocystis]
MRTCSHTELTAEIVQECHSQFKSLPKHGKPVKRSNGQIEWTILAGIVMATPRSQDDLWDLECISIGTGSKCLPQGKQSPRGDLLNDCHAEVLARRGFNSPDTPGGPLFELVQPKAQFHLYISQAPCGDASTGSLAQVQSEESRNAFLKGKNQDQENTGENDQGVELGTKRLQEVVSDSVTNESGTVKRAKLEERQDELSNTKSKQALGIRRGRINYDAVGVLRTKPGRVDSEPTMSMSCSDKIARWNILGLTSALVAPFLAPIYLSSVIIKELFDADALERALFKRLEAGCKEIKSEDSYKLHRVGIHSTEIVFEHSKDEVARSLQGGLSTAVASASTSSKGPSEVLINGCKAGASAKKQIPPKSRSRLCKVEMLQCAVSLWRSIPTLEHELCLVHQLRTPFELNATDLGTDTKSTYRAWKGMSSGYAQARRRLFASVFQNWVRSGDDLEQFTV